MKDRQFAREDGQYLDFEQVTEGSIILVNKLHEHNRWGAYAGTNKYPYIKLEKNDIWIIEALANRPRVAVIRNLQRNVESGIRVDVLLELDDAGIITIGPGPDRSSRND